MILYAIECKGDITNNDWSIVTIWKDLDTASNHMRRYEFNAEENDAELKYRIKLLDTDDDCVYDYDE